MLPAIHTIGSPNHSNEFHLNLITKLLVTTVTSLATLKESAIGMVKVSQHRENVSCVDSKDTLHLDAELKLVSVRETPETLAKTGPIAKGSAIK